MAKKLFLLVLVLILIPVVYSAKVGVIVSLPTGIYGECVEVTDNSNGYQVLEATDLNLLWAGPSAYGHLLCKINGVGDDISGDYCAYSGNYWGFFISKNNSWSYMPVGFDGGSSCWNSDLSSWDGHYCAKDGDVIGFKYGDGSELPAHYSFDRVCSPLKLKDVSVRVDGDKENADQDGGDIEAKPGSKIRFDIEIENEYIFDDNLEIKDIEAKISIDDVDDGDDIEEEVSFNDLDEGDDEEKTIEITLPILIEDENYKIILKITGETNNGLDQEIEVGYDLEINKEKHDVIISKAELGTETSCSGSNNHLLIKLVNLGEKGEEDVVLNVNSGYLNLAFSETFDLDAGADQDDVVYEKTLSFQVPDGLAPGDYLITIGVDYSESVDDEVVLTVNDCNYIQTNTDYEPENNVIVVQKSSLSSQSQMYVAEKSFFEKHGNMILIGIAELALIIVVIFVITAIRR